MIKINKKMFEKDIFFKIIEMEDYLIKVIGILNKQRLTNTIIQIQQKLYKVYKINNNIRTLCFNVIKKERGLK